MSYIGSTPTTQSFIAGTDTFSGTGSQTVFVLSRPVNTVNDILVVVNNVDQQPSAYTVAGSSLTLSAAPSSGTNNVYVRYLSTTLISTSGGGASTPAAVSDQVNTSTGYFGLPAGTTAQRPASPAYGFTRYNTTLNSVEYYNGTAWFAITSTSTAVYAIQYLIVAGGGAGGGYVSGGGGAGGVVQGTLTATAGTTYTAVVGAGGVHVVGNNTPGAVGNNSTLTGITAAVGGGGGAAGGGGSGSATTGGSGGGGGSTTASLVGAAGTSGQGFAGGTAPGQAVNYPSGGGGGSGSVGASPANTSSAGGNGGSGTTSSITGFAVNYAGGGGAAAIGTAGTGQAGGGNGGLYNGSGVYLGSSTSGTANTGGGGGGGRGSGGSGVVILSVPSAVYSSVTTGSPTVTVSGSNTIITFTASGSYTA